MSNATQTAKPSSDSYQAWTKYLKSRKGQWTTDQIHNGKDGRDLLCYLPNRDDETSGSFIQAGLDGKLVAGTYEGAVPHIGEAAFKALWTHQAASFRHAVVLVVYRCALNLALPK